MWHCIFFRLKHVETDFVVVVAKFQCCRFHSHVVVRTEIKFNRAPLLRPSRFDAILLLVCESREGFLHNINNNNKLVILQLRKRERERERKREREEAREREREREREGRRERGGRAKSCQNVNVTQCY